MDKPVSLEITKLLRPVLGYVALVVVAVVASNSMPFYTDGTRMGLPEGIPAIIDGASPTAPYASGTEGSATAIANVPKTYPDPISRRVGELGRGIGLDGGTTQILVVLGLLFLLRILWRSLRIPYVLTYNRFMPKAWDEKRSSATLRATVSINVLIITVVIAAIIVAAVAAVMVAIGAYSVENVPTTYQITPLAIAAVVGIGIGLWHGGWVRRSYDTLLTRRCKKCNAMDSFRVLDYKETGRQHMTKTTTTTYKDGHRDVDTDKYTMVDSEALRECQNCGYRVRRYGQHSRTGHV